MSTQAIKTTAQPTKTISGTQAKTTVGEGKPGASNPATHKKEDGTPDHRFEENRADRQHTSNGEGKALAHPMPSSDIHLTQDGAPDRRFPENRILTPEQAEIQKAMLVLKKAGITKIE